jgi:hypothetical protein
MCVRFLNGKVAPGLKVVWQSCSVPEALAELDSSCRMKYVLGSSQSAIPYTLAVAQLYEILRKPSSTVQVLMELELLHGMNVASRSL